MRFAPSASVAGLAVCLWVAGAVAGGAKETDSFTHRYEALAFPVGEVDGQPVSDFTDEFNRHFQQTFSLVLDELNQKGQHRGESCRTDRARRRLFHRLSNALGGPVVITDNRLRPAITGQPNSYRTRMSESIYRDFAPWRSISLGLAAKLGHKLAVLFRFDLQETLVEAGGSVVRSTDGRLAVIGPEGVATPVPLRLRGAEPAILPHRGRTYYLLDSGQALTELDGAVQRVTPILVSSDKISHFFNRSLGLFKKLGAGAEADFDRIAARNLWLEASLFGSRSTGVAAYGDLVANFQGVRFWIHLLGRGYDGRPLPDPLAAGPRAPLVECAASGDWVASRPVDIRDYLDPAWDEALNCSRLRSPVLLGQVQRRIEALAERDRLGRTYECPVNGGLIAETAAGYGRFADQVINARGHSALRSRGR